jgi:IS30 family transposase
MLKMQKTKTSEAIEVSLVINEMLKDWISCINTITADDGKEFSEHKKIAEACQVHFYFANPYPPWATRN